MQLGTSPSSVRSRPIGVRPLGPSPSVLGRIWAAPYMGASLGTKRPSATACQQFTKVSWKLRGKCISEPPEAIAAELDLFPSQQENKKRCGIRAGNARHATGGQRGQPDQTIAWRTGISSNRNSGQEGVREAGGKRGPIHREILIRMQ